jgi:MFS transporter, SET family, sugar efflux transporter
VLRKLLPLALVFLAIGLSTAMYTPFLALFLNDEVHADALRVGLFLAAAPISLVILASLVGRLSDRLADRKWVLIGTALAGFAGTGLTAVVRDYWALLAITVTITAAAGGVMPQVFAYAREALRQSAKVGLAMSSLRSLFSTAWVAGPPLAAALLEAGGFRLVYGIAALVYLVAAIIVLLAVRGRRSPPGDPARPEPPDGVDAPRALIWVSIGAILLTRCAGNLSIQALPLLTTQDLHGGVGEAGFLLGLCAALEIPLMLAFGALSTRVPVYRLLLVGTVCEIGYLTLVAVATNTWELAAGQVLNAASIAALTGLAITYVQDMLPRHPGRASTLYSNTIPAGAVLAGPVLGAAQHFGYRMPYVLGAVLCLAALALFGALRGPLRRGGTGTPPGRAPAAAPAGSTPAPRRT